MKKINNEFVEKYVYFILAFVIGLFSFSCLVSLWHLIIWLLSMLNESTAMLELLYGLPREHRLWFWLATFYVIGHFFNIMYGIGKGGFKLSLKILCDKVIQKSKKR